MSLSRQDVERIARLARIELSASETDATLTQLQSIFTLIEKMQAVDTSKVEALTTPLSAITEFTLRLREDVITETDQRETFLDIAPLQRDGLYLVPRVVE